MTTIDNINYEADKGKVFIRKSDNLIMGHGLGLGKVDCPDEFKGLEGYDNTMHAESEIVDSSSSIV